MHEKKYESTQKDMLFTLIFNVTIIKKKITENRRRKIVKHSSKLSL